MDVYDEVDRRETDAGEVLVMVENIQYFISYSYLSGLERCARLLVMYIIIL